jgi:hypothetical protein
VDVREARFTWNGHEPGTAWSAHSTASRHRRLWSSAMAAGRRSGLHRADRGAEPASAGQLYFTISSDAGTASTCRTRPRSSGRRSLQGRAGRAQPAPGHRRRHDVVGQSWAACSRWSMPSTIPKACAGSSSPTRGEHGPLGVGGEPAPRGGAGDADPSRAGRHHRRPGVRHGGAGLPRPPSVPRCPGQTACSGASTRWTPTRPSTTR